MVFFLKKRKFVDRSISRNHIGYRKEEESRQLIPITPSIVRWSEQKFVLWLNKPGIMIVML